MRGATRTVDLPRQGRQRVDAKVVQDGALADGRVVEHVNVGRVRLVVHAPAAVEEDELARRHEALHLRLQRRRLALEPDLEESLLDVREAARRVGEQPLHDNVDDLRHVAAADGPVALEVLHAAGRGGR